MFNKKEYDKKWRSKNKEKLVVLTAKWRSKNRDKYRNTNRKHYQKLRRIVLEHYGNQCQCCGEMRMEFLAIDHINGGGSKERKKRDARTNYRYLIANNFPKDFQILCHNCNAAKGFYGQCPHERLKRVSIA